MPDAPARGAATRSAPRKSRTILTVVLPGRAARHRVGCLLAVARAAGETAPLLFTIGARPTANRNLFEGANTALSMQIFGNATQPFVGAQDRAWGAALTLIVLAFLFTLIARLRHAPGSLSKTVSRMPERQEATDDDR